MVLMDIDPVRRNSTTTSTGVKEEHKRPVAVRRGVDSYHRTSSTRLRSNLLRKLGIPPSSTALRVQQQQQQRIPSAKSLLGNEVQRLPLKTDDQSENGNSNSKDKVYDALSSSSLLMPTCWSQHQHHQPTTTHHRPATTDSTTSDDSHRRNVHFDPQVSVVSIPHRHEYSTRTRKFLWESPDQMHINIVRNTLEFRADGWDWHTVLEEEEHYYCPLAQEYIHPIHMEIVDMTPEEQASLVPSTYVNPAQSLLENVTNPTTANASVSLSSQPTLQL
ncbi:expressed unknown protein [Seminavis robusta]|uniref:Uncharacterized protein n=1 Tax=Seminavis robusta TaxID=568900 RepID=A0A9N8DQC0_9STRA|nr:expressed unknown protein [Seminavis robusta]|eukprot:Sro296_g110610.1 n/a (275) ;mRNA; r:14153-14977